MSLKTWLLDKLTFDIPNEDTGEVYLRRWYLMPPCEREGFWKNFPIGVKLHEIRKSDRGRHLHDHPWPFVSVILRGGYWEETPEGLKWYPAGSVIVHRDPEDLHRLIVDHEDRTLTLVVTGKKVRNWGFATENGWIDHQTYIHSSDYVDYRA